MVFEVFLDINILLDFFLKRKDFTHAQKVLLLAKDREIDAFVSISILQTTSYYLQKDFGSKMAKELLLELLLIVNVIDADEDIVLQALNSSIYDIEDAIHFYTATKSNISYIISSDLDFQKLSHRKLEIMSAEKFIELF